MPKRRTYRHTIEFISWDDAGHDMEDADVHDTYPKDIVDSVGHVIQECDDYVLMSRDADQEDWVRARLRIPKKYILQRVVLKKGRASNGAKGKKR